MEINVYFMQDGNYISLLCYIHVYSRDVYAGGSGGQNAQRVVCNRLSRRLFRSNHAKHVVLAGKHVASVDHQHTASVWQAARTGAQTAREERLVDNRGVGFARR